MIAVDIESEAVVGLVDAEIWTRSKQRVTSRHSRTAHRTAKASVFGLHAAGFAGDDVGFDLMANGGMNNYNSFMGFTLGSVFLRNDWENAPQDTLHPIVRGVNGSPSAGRFMHLNGDCPIINQFDLFTLSSTASTIGK